MTPSRFLPSRREFLQATGAAAAMATLPGVASGAARSARTTTYAFISDTHVDPEIEDRTAALRAVLAAIEAKDPALVVNGGDVTDDGSAYQYQAYCDLVPDSLRGRMLHVPGNHDARHDASAYETWDRFLANDEFGGARNSSVVTPDGLHWCLPDLTVAQQSAVRLDEPTRDWLGGALERNGADRPTVIVSHHPPMGDEYYFLQNSETFAETIQPFRVRAILCGHMHAERVRRLNGLTVVAGKALKQVTGDIGFYLLTRVQDGDRDVLTVEFVSVPLTPATAAAEPRPVTSIDLAADVADLEPAEISAGVDRTGDALTVRAGFDRGQPVASVSALVYNQDIWVGRDKDGQTWTPLVADGNGFAGDLPFGHEPPGEHRAILRVEGTSGEIWREIVTVTKPGDGFAPMWRHSMGDMVHSALAHHDGLLVAATVAGRVSAFRPGAGRSRPQWTRRIGPVYSRLAFAADGGTIYAPSSDHHLYALDARTGRELWRTDLGVPVMADPLVTQIDGEPQAILFAGETLYCLDAGSGRVRWRRDFGVRSMGRAACDGELVYVGVGDGRVHAIDARDPRRTAWTQLLTDRPDTHGRLTKGPWDCQVLLAGRTAVVGTKDNGFGLRLDDGGTPAWSRPGSFIFCPPVLVGSDVLTIDEAGHALLVDPSTGAARWEASLPVQLFGPGVVTRGSDAYVTSSTGSVHLLDLRTGGHRELRQVCKEGIIATPALCDGDTTFVVAGMDGMLQAFEA
ncbi:PQQ-binding-like beta-propeller repeat protein [Jiangella asiatica]|nr:PQQ-binding-like beta-propeller repeat protein [Jiangella asiatica]